MTRIILPLDCTAPDPSEETAIHRLNPTHQLFLSIKFYWNTTVAICLGVVSSCFSAAMTELSSHSRGHLDHKAGNIYRLSPYRKYSLTPDLKDDHLQERSHMGPKDQASTGHSHSCHLHHFPTTEVLCEREVNLNLV